MTDRSLQDAIEDEYETELSRLGSSKAIYALTGGEMETEAVLAALADRAATAAETFSRWSGEGPRGDVYRAAAETAGDHVDRIAGTADDAEATDSPQPMDEVLRGVEDPDGRLGGLLAWTMVTDRTLSQAVGFFVGNADATAADRFRDLRSEVADLREEVLGLLDGEDGGARAPVDRDAALEAASDVVEAAYEHYVETLEGLGVKVKPVC